MHNDLVCLSKIHDCSVMIRGLELDKDLYTKHFTKDQFRYIDTVTINFVTCYDCDQHEVSSEYVVCEHDKLHVDMVEYAFPHDGLYKISHMIVPTLKWIENYKKTFNEDPSVEFKHIYIYDNGNLYKYRCGCYTKVDFNELFEVNPISGVALLNSEVYTFSICLLEECFINKYKEFLNKLCPKAKCDTSEDAKIRDLIWMGIHTIKYYINLGRYFDAQRILEKLESCNGVCANLGFNKALGKSGCGCNKGS